MDEILHARSIDPIDREVLPRRLLRGSTSETGNLMLMKSENKRKIRLDSPIVITNPKSILILHTTVIIQIKSPTFEAVRG